jgi:hypothetical protein
MPEEDDHAYRPKQQARSAEELSAAAETLGRLGDRKAIGPPLSGLKKLVAIVTDEPLETRARQFGPDDAKAISDLIEKGFIKPQKQRTVLYVNTSPITLASFPGEFVTSTVIGLLSALKGVEHPESIDLFIRTK